MRKELGCEIAGELSWCAFDYNTRDYVLASDWICYHGISDVFRIPKQEAVFYKSPDKTSDKRFAIGQNFKRRVFIAAGKRD